MSDTYNNNDNYNINIINFGKKERIRGESRTRWTEKDKAVVVAVEKDNKASQHALKFAIDRFVSKDKSRRTCLVLLYVHLQYPAIFPIYDSYDLSSRNTTTTSFVEREPDDHDLEVLRPFRHLCMHKQIKFKIVVVEDFDMGQALVDYAIRHRVENLILGATSSRNGFSRLFKNGSYIPSTVRKWIPDFCNVYIISNLGKLRGVRNACRSVPNIPQDQTHHHHQDMGGAPSENLEEEIISEAEFEICYLSPEISPTTDTMFLDFSDFNSLPSIQSPKPHLHDDFHFLHEVSSISSDCERTSLFLTHKLISIEEEMKRLKLEQKQRMGVYNLDCKEPLAP